MGLSLWIVPNTATAYKLYLVMKTRKNSSQSAQLAKESYPTFHPHITLASLPLSMKSNLDAIAASIPKLNAPLTCNFASVDIGLHYYRSVYVRIELASEVVDLHKYVHDALGVEPKTPAFPHMSLCYIKDADAEINGEREAYFAALKDGGKIQIHGDDFTKRGVSLDCGSSGKLDWVDHFEAHEIWAVLCDGPVEQWDVLRRFPLEVAEPLDRMNCGVE